MGWPIDLLSALLPRFPIEGLKESRIEGLMEVEGKVQV